MNAKTNTKLLVLLSVLLILVSGCAATASTPTSSQEVSTLNNVDRYHAAVEAQARKNGAEVHWVNLPDEGDLARYTTADTEEASGNSN